MRGRSKSSVANSKCSTKKQEQNRVLQLSDHNVLQKKKKKILQKLSDHKFLLFFLRENVLKKSLELPNAFSKKKTLQNLISHFRFANSFF